MQTLTLARLCPDSMITASDIYTPFFNDLTLRGKNAGLDGKNRDASGLIG